MFSNLIESNADMSAFKRRSSFFLFTVAAYALILFAAGVIGILTYDARVEAQATDLTLLDWIPPVKQVTPEGPQPVRPTRPHVASNAPVDPHITQPVRTAAQTDTTDPRAIPDAIATTGTQLPPAVGPIKIGTQNLDPVSVGPRLPACVMCADITPPRVVETETPPPLPPKPTTIRATSKVILANVVDLPKPIYPTIAKQAGIQGAVNVQILIDETGRVISAQAVKGSPMLTKAAEDAARRARFTPTRLGDDPVKVSGVIVYNFVLR